MFQTTEATKHPPQILARLRRQAKAPQKSVLQSVVRAAIMPLRDEPDLLDLMCGLQQDNDIMSAIALYEAYSTIAQIFVAAQNQPRTKQRATDYLEEEYSRAWAKAYLVADRLKDMRPNKLNVDFYSKTLLACASEMGATMKEIVAIATEIAAMPVEYPATERLNRTAPAIAATTAPSCPAEELAREYEQIAARLIGPDLNKEDAVTDALEASLLQMADVAADLTARTNTGTAFLVMLASSEIDRILNGNERRWQEAAAKRLEKLLYGILERFESSAAALPATRKWVMPSDLDPRENLPLVEGSR